MQDVYTYISIENNLTLLYNSFKFSIRWTIFNWFKNKKGQKWHWYCFINWHLKVLIHFIFKIERLLGCYKTIYHKHYHTLADGPDDFKVACITYNVNATVVFDFSKNTNLSSLTSAIRSITKDGGPTYAVHVLRKAREVSNSFGYTSI